jgi:uncharacterized protein (DUF608 family)
MVKFMASKSRPSAKSISLQPLFPEGLPTRKWLEFSAMGYSIPVSGAIFTSDQPPCCGVPLGGISTGCLDIDPRGVFGYSSMFNPGSLHDEFENWRYPRRKPDLQPFLGLAIGNQTWVLSDASMASGEVVEWCTEPQQQITETGFKMAKPIQIKTPKLEGVKFAHHISYWGHFPVADMEFETDAPIKVGLRAWAPFIPGDATSSNIPAAVFEVHLRNSTESIQAGTLAFSFAGPSIQEARSTEFTRTLIQEDFNGMLVASPAGINYLVGVSGEEIVRFGAGLSRDAQSWSQIARQLPSPSFHQEAGLVLFDDGSCSAAVDFKLPANTEKVVRFSLVWYAPLIEGAKKTWKDEVIVCGAYQHIRWIGSEWEGNTHFYTQMYASRFTNAMDVARVMMAQHGSLWERIVAWQEAIYSDQNFPSWLRDSLVNNLGLVAEDSHWFQPKPPLGDWAFPLGGFGLNESPRACPQMSCIPCEWYGNLPIVFFFPELARQTLRMFKQYQKSDGEIPFALGKSTDLPDMATPEYYWQVSLNGMCYIDMVDRLWQRTGDDAILREFYDSVKHCNTFTINLRKGHGGPISMPEIGGMEWFEFGEWAGMATHLGGLRLAELLMMERMAEAMGDGDYARQCRAWLEDGSSAMEEEMWTGSYYLNFYEKETGKISDDVMGYQLDGEWAARYHGFPVVFRFDRVRITLDTVKRCNIALCSEIGAANFARPDGSALSSKSKVALYGRFTMFSPEMVVLGMTYIYAGDKEYGLDLVRKHWENLCLKQGHGWDLPNMVRGDTGQRVLGTDYYQNMMLWALPAAVTGQDLRSSCASGSLIERVIKAGKKK